MKLAASNAGNDRSRCGEHLGETGKRNVEQTLSKFLPKSLGGMLLYLCPKIYWENRINGTTHRNVSILLDIVNREILYGDVIDVIQCHRIQTDNAVVNVISWVQAGHIKVMERSWGQAAVQVFSTESDKLMSDQSVLMVIYSLH